MTREISRFATLRGGPEESPGSESALPDEADPRFAKALTELERDASHLDESNPRDMARMMRKMKDWMPPGATPKALEIALQRLESGEDPEKIEEDMGDAFEEMTGESDSPGRRRSARKPYRRDPKLYDYE